MVIWAKVESFSLVKNSNSSKAVIFNGCGSLINEPIGINRFAYASNPCNLPFNLLDNWWLLPFYKVRAWGNSYRLYLVHLFRYPGRSAHLLLYLKQSFEFYQLSLETHIGENNWTAFTSKCKRLLKGHWLVLHYEGNHTARGTAHSCVTMNKYPTSLDSFFYESNSSWEMSD